VFRNNGNWMLMWEDGMRNFLSAAQHLTMHSSETVRSIKKQGSQVLLHYRVWVRRPVWLILTWAHSRTPRVATHSTIIFATNPILPVLGFNMELHSDKPATNCLPQFTAYCALHCLVFDRGNLSGTHLCRIDVKDKGKSSSDETTWENASYI